MTPSLRSRLLEALEPFVKVPGQTRTFGGPLLALKALYEDGGHFSRLAALYDELKGGDASVHGNPASNETTPPSASEPAGAGKALGDLLAIIHRDGGHYQAAHGTKAAVEAAHKVWADLQTRAEASADPAGAEVKDIETHLRRIYIVRADDRQKEMGLSYITAETSDLARTIAAMQSDTITRLTAELAEARRVIAGLEEALRKDSRQHSILSDTVEYHLDGQTMYHAINRARAFLSSHPEKETK